MNPLKRIVEAMFGRSRKKVEAPARVEDIEAEVREIVTRDVRAGFTTDDEIVDSVVEVLSDDYEASIVLPIAEIEVRRAVDAIIAEQSSWPAVTDVDRLDTAFAALEADGIVARQNFSCCGSCGAGEMRDLMKREEKKGRTIRGYTFFHMQDTERVAEGDGLYLAFGANAKGRPAAEAVARSIVGALESTGLAVEWDGSCSTRVYVKMDWKKRRQTAQPGATDNPGDAQ